MLTTAIPKLPFIDKAKTLDYYLQQLQFELHSDYGDYVLLKKDSVELHFFHFPTLKPRKSDFMIYIQVDADIDGLVSGISGARHRYSSQCAAGG